MAEPATRTTAQNIRWDDWIRDYLEGRLRLNAGRAGLQPRGLQATDRSVADARLKGGDRYRPRIVASPVSEGAKQAARAKIDANRRLGVRVAGQLAERVGNVAGLGRGGVHAVQGLAEGAHFISRLHNPLDRWLSPPGESAGEQVIDAAARGVGYVRRGVADPSTLIRDVRDRAHRMRLDLDPAATQAAPTVKDEVQRRLDIGMNQGELVFDVGSIVLGGPLAKSVESLAAVSKAPTAAKYLAQGFTPAQAAHLAEPYPASGMGHHFFPLRKGSQSAFVDSVYNVLRPRGITRGDMYELHYKVDPHFYGTGFPRRMAGARWRGGALDLKKYGLAGRLWYGSPAPLKARVGGLGAGAGEVAHGLTSEETLP